MGVLLGKLPMTRSHFDCVIFRCLRLDGAVELQTGAAYVRMDRMMSLYNANLVVTGRVESRARREKSLHRTPSAFCEVVLMWLEKRSLESRRTPRYLTCGAHGITACWQRNGGGVVGRRRVKRMISVLCVFTCSFHREKYLSRSVEA